MTIDIWNKFKKYFIEDFRNSRTWHELKKIFHNEKTNCKNFGLPEPNYNLEDTENLVQALKLQFYKEEFQKLYQNLSFEQHTIFQEIVSGYYNYSYIDGPGVSGKTYLYTTIIF